MFQVYEIMFHQLEQFVSFFSLNCFFINKLQFFTEKTFFLFNIVSIKTTYKNARNLLFYANKIYTPESINTEENTNKQNRSIDTVINLSLAAQPVVCIGWDYPTDPQFK